MFTTRQTILASRPAAMVLALSLVAGLTAPFVFLSRVHVAAAATAPVTCSAANNNGCTELSPTPPEDTVAVPPNIVLMLDDSGSMAWDYMPDACYLYGVTCANYYSSDGTNPINGNGVDYITAINNDAMINSANNGVYYNPSIAYTPPPQADGTLYPNATGLTSAWSNGFTQSGSTNLTNYTSNDVTGEYDNQSKPLSYSASRQVTSTTAATYVGYFNRQWKCEREYDNDGGFGGYTYDSNSGKCTFQYYPVTTYRYFQYSTGPAAGPYVVHYVAPASQGCGPLSATTTPTCVLDNDTSGAAAPSGVTAGQNIANWFAYDHTRILMAKTGLMTAFNNLNPSYRFGFGSIDGNNKAAISSPGSNYSSFSTAYSYTDGNGNSNYIAQVYPFGAAQISDPSDPTGATKINNPDSRRYQFWDWIANEKANNGTPLRKALQAAGKYYQTSQPWSTMPGDPGYTAGSTTKFACRASYTILTTDGFWNGSSPGVGNVDGGDGPTYTPPAGKTYTTTGYVAQAPFSDSNSNTLADVAMYYWENDLQSSIPNEVAPSTQDPAFWQHMTTFTMGLGFTPYGIAPTGTTIPQIFAWAKGGAAISGFGWPSPSSNSLYNIADLAHAAVNGHGDFFSIKSPQDMAAGFAKAISDINARNVPPTTAAINTSVLSIGAVSFSTGYNTGDWSGVLQAESLNTDGTVGSVLWKAGALLDAAYHSSQYTNRTVYTDAYNVSGGTFSAFQFDAANSGSLDTSETSGLETPALTGGNDTLQNRMAYILGDDTYEGTLYRTRSSLLGAIINSEPVYVAGASGNYYANWPTIGGIAPPENAAGAQAYDTFVSNESSRTSMVYVGANDGMLHAFYAPVPKCTGTVDADGNCSAYTFAAGSNPGKEAWAFIPRAVYDNLGNLTDANFSFRPTVDESPVTRDVFFSENGDSDWHTILVGGVGLGGRGVYALDITNPGSFSTSDVLWEFDSDMSVDSGCVASYGSCQATDLGYTIGNPNIGRLADGKWVVLVSNGYFPDCTTPDYPTSDSTACQAIANQAPKDSSGNPYSALFVMDAQTGKMIAELKTPTNISGVTSFGLATPVLGDYNGDQVDDVAFAGDAEGNLWRFDLSSTSAASWTVTLVYKGLANGSGKQGLQPITTMPRLFPDPSDNRFMVVFGTGKFLGVGDNSDTQVQAIYGVRDDGNTYDQSDLTEQYLHEEVAPATLPDGSPNPNAGLTLRCVTGSASDTDCSSSGTAINPIPATGSGSGGWFINLKTTLDGVQTDAGERVVVTPASIFATNSVVIETLITGSQSSDPCSPSTQGAIMVIGATTGAPGNTSLGGWPIAGARISNAKTGGTVPVASGLGGGKGSVLGTNPKIDFGEPAWRRRSWSEINQNQ